MDSRINILSPFSAATDLLQAGEKQLNPLTVSPQAPEIQAELQRLESTLQALAGHVCVHAEKLAPVLAEPVYAVADGGVQMVPPSTPLGQYVRALDAQACSVLNSLLNITGRIGF